MKRVTQPPEVAAPIRIANLSTTERYSPKWQPLRPGADAHERIPSRRAGERVWRDGKREAS